MAQVKQHYRKGKIVHSFFRKDKLKKKKVKPAGTFKKILKGAAIGTAVLGLGSVGGYHLLKKRYISNLNIFAENLQNSTKFLERQGLDHLKIPDNKDALTFTVGGFIHSGAQSTVLKSGLQKSLPDHHIVPFTFQRFDTPVKLLKNGKPTVQSDLVQSATMFDNVIVKGENSDSYRLAEEVYKHHLANPGKPINFVSFSAGGAVSRDAAYILKKLGIDSKIVTMGHAEAGITPNVVPIKALMNKRDSKRLEYRLFKNKKAELLTEGEEHSPKTYIQDKTVKAKIVDFLGTKKEKQQ